MLAASIVIRSKSGAPFTTPILLEGGRRPYHEEDGIGAPLSDLITIEAANIWGKLFLSRRLFILDSTNEAEIGIVTLI